MAEKNTLVQADSEPDAPPGEDTANTSLPQLAELSGGAESGQAATASAVQTSDAPPENKPNHAPPPKPAGPSSGAELGQAAANTATAMTPDSASNGKSACTDEARSPNRIATCLCTTIK